MKNGGNGLVYSTEQGRLCPDCGRAIAFCECRRGDGKSVTAKSSVPNDGIVRVGRETKGRKGAGVTVITGIPLDAAGRADLCTQLKKRCGSGGAVKDGVIEIQGDHRDTILTALSQKGWTVKRVGG